jgi:hypothetical protein
MTRILTAFVCILVFEILCVDTRGGSSRHGDRLEGMDATSDSEMGSDYRALYEKELFVTPGRLARFVQLPGPVNQPEISVALDQIPHGASYTLTGTKPTKILANLVPRQKNAHPPAELVPVSRKDAPIPKSTALAIHKLWLTMLQHQAQPRFVIGEGTTEIFSAEGPDGKQLRAALPPGAGKTTTELAKIGFMLFDYCYDPVSDRAKKAHEIEERVSSLRRSVESHQ